MTDLTPIPTFPHDPNAVLDYLWNWESWLADGDAIASAEVFKVEGDAVVIDEVENTSTTVTAWVSGGTEGTHAHLTARITTTQGRTDDRTLRLYVEQR